MPNLGCSCRLCKHKSKYKRKNNINSILNNLYSQLETSNLECDFFQKKSYSRSEASDSECKVLSTENLISIEP